MSEFDRITRKLHCTCLHEMESNLPATKRCFRPCLPQVKILAQRAAKQWWSGLDHTAKEALAANYSVLTTTEIEKLHLTEHRKSL